MLDYDLLQLCGVLPHLIGTHLSPHQQTRSYIVYKCFKHVPWDFHSIYPRVVMFIPRDSPIYNQTSKVITLYYYLTLVWKKCTIPLNYC